MSIANLLIRKKIGKIDAIELDVIISESHDLPSTITKFPIESGAEISDHIILEPITLTMEGFITNTPIGLFAGRLGAIIRNQPYDKQKQSYEELIKLRNSRQPFTVVTGLTTYENMVFVSLSIPKNREIGSALQFTAVLTQIRKVNSKTIRLSDIAGDYVDKAKAEANKGLQSTKTVAENSRLQSVSFKFGKAIKNFFGNLFSWK